MIQTIFYIQNVINSVPNTVWHISCHFSAWEMYWVIFFWRKKIIKQTSVYTCELILIYSVSSICIRHVRLLCAEKTQHLGCGCRSVFSPLAQPTERKLPSPLIGLRCEPQLTVLNLLLFFTITIFQAHKCFDLFLPRGGVQTEVLTGILIDPLLHLRGHCDGSSI